MSADGGRRRFAGKVLRLTVFAAVTVALVLAARKIDWPHALRLLATTRPAWLVAAVIANGAILLWWAGYWRTLRPLDEAPVTYGRMFQVVAAASSLMNTLPFGGGHASSIVILVRDARTTQRGALSVLALDQLGEGISKVGVFVLVALLAPLPGWMRAGIITASLAVCAWFVAMLIASRYARQLAILRDPTRSATALGCVLAMKATAALAIAAVQHAFGLNVGASGTMLVLAAVVLGTMLPLAPGNLGTYEASAFLAYRYLGISSDQALGLAVMQHVCFMLPAVGIGYVGLSRRVLRGAVVARSVVSPGVELQQLELPRSTANQRENTRE